ncbi:MAG TPA: c-type cytochrome, partial [Polyangiales bacterium]|nr:c-type cytochrome [Polyangiales bacterium]
LFSFGLGVFVALSCALAIGCNHEPAPISKQKLEVARQDEALTRGGELYGRMCKVCHGADGEGYKADNAPALSNQQFLAAVDDKSMFASIFEGRPNTVMSAWASSRGGPLSNGDIDALVKFIRAWQKVPSAKLDERPLRGDAARGQPIYDRECVKCHGARGLGGPNIRIGDPAWLARSSDGFLRYTIAHGRAPTPMPAFTQLDAQSIDDLITLLRGFANGPGAPPPLPPPPSMPPPIPLGPVPLNPKGPEPVGFVVHPGTTSATLVHDQLAKGARMALLDARASSDYTGEHIAGAVSVPFYDPAPYFDKLPKDAWLVCYCACPHAESGELAQKLVTAGFKKVTVLDEGLGTWKAKGWKTSTGPKP